MRRNMAPTTLHNSVGVLDVTAKAWILFALAAVIVTADPDPWITSTRHVIDNINSTIVTNIADASGYYYNTTEGSGQVVHPDVAQHILDSEKFAVIGDSKLLPLVTSSSQMIQVDHSVIINDEVDSTTKTVLRLATNDRRKDGLDSSARLVVNSGNVPRLMTEPAVDTDSVTMLAIIPVDSFPVKPKRNAYPKTTVTSSVAAPTTIVNTNITSYDDENATEVYVSGGAEFPQDNSILSTVTIDSTNGTMISDTESLGTDFLGEDHGITSDIYSRFHLPDSSAIASTFEETDIASVTEYTDNAVDFLSAQPRPIEPSTGNNDSKVTIATPSSVGSVVIKSAGGVVDVPWPVKKEAVVEGDLVLGGLMMVHEREDSVTCGPVMPQGGVQALEAMLYTLDMINDGLVHEVNMPNVSLGAHILDDCDKDTYGLEMAVDFIKGSISNIDGAEYSCNKTQVRKVISGVVGAASSVTSIQVANLLRLFKIPQVSFFSTSPELSNKQRFEFFTRTIPSDLYQVKAMVDIIITMGWSYVSIIYEESNYGIKAFEELEDLLAEHNICIAVKEKLVKDSGVADESAYDNIVQKLLTKPRARGCIIFGSDQEVAGVMRAVRRSNATGSFSWIGSDGWSARSLVSDGNEAEVEGTLSVQPQANPVRGFHDYFLSLNVENNRRNPWFVEFWEDHFQCKYPNSSWTPYNRKYGDRPCSGREQLTKNNTVFEDQLQFVSDAVMAFAHAIKNMHAELCQGRQGLCDTMRPTKGSELLKYLRKVNFTGLSGDQFRFDMNGDGPARYNIIHFKQVLSGKYKWVRVGEYLEGKLILNMSEVQFKLGHPKPPESVCSLPCDLGQAKKYVEGESCCWHCFNCTQYQLSADCQPDMYFI